MSFIFKKNLVANSGRILMSFPVTTTITISVGDSCEFVGDALTVTEDAGSGAALGVVVGLRKADGSPLTDNGAGGDFSGTYTTTDSTSVYAEVDVSRESVYSVAADATLGTTTGSDMPGYTMDCVAGGTTLDESTAQTTAGTYMSLGPDPDPSAPDNSVLVMLYESDLWNL
jgi:hypothetical protein